MKTIYQLIVTFNDGGQANLLYSTLKKALNDSKNRYPAGHTIEGVGTITNNFIEKRYLF